MQNSYGIIHRVGELTRYTKVNNNVIENDNLSFKARGLLIFLLSKPNNWRVNSNHLTDSGPDGRTSILSALKELEDIGYLKRKRERNDKGMWIYTSELFEEPCVDYPKSGNPTLDNPTSGNPTSGNPTSGNPPIVVNTEQVNTEVVKTEVVKTEQQQQQSSFVREEQRLNNLLDEKKITHDYTDVEIALKKGYSPEWIEDAIDIAFGSGHLYWPYVAGILKNWREKGNPKELKAEAAAHKYDIPDDLKDIIVGYVSDAELAGE